MEFFQALASPGLAEEGNRRCDNQSQHSKTRAPGCVCQELADRVPGGGRGSGAGILHGQDGGVLWARDGVGTGDVKR